MSCGWSVCQQKGYDLEGEEKEREKENCAQKGDEEKVKVKDGTAHAFWPHHPALLTAGWWSQIY